MLLEIKMNNGDDIIVSGVTKIIDTGEKITLFSNEEHDISVTINRRSPFDADTMDFPKNVTGVMKILG